MRQTNSGSIIECKVDATTLIFLWLYTYFHACFVGFFCERISLICWMELVCKQVQWMLVEYCCNDANDDIFTLAHIIVDAKNDNNFEWFAMN